MSTSRLHLDHARALAGAYDDAAALVDGRRGSLLVPMATARGLLGRSPEIDVAENLRALAERLRSDGADIGWRVDYVEAMGGQPLGDGRFVADVPARSSRWRTATRDELLDQLGQAADLSDHEIAALLNELLIRTATHPDVAAAAVSRLGPEGLDRLVGRAYELMAEEAEDAGRAWHRGQWDPDVAPRFDMDAMDSGGWPAAWQGASPGTRILEPLGALVGAATSGPNPPAWLAEHLLPADASAADILTTTLLASAGVWDAELLEATWTWLFEVESQELLIAASAVPGNSAGALSSYFMPPIFSDLADPVEVVLSAIGRNPEAAWSFVTGGWEHPTVELAFDRRDVHRELFDDMPMYWPTMMVNPAGNLGAGLGRLLVGASEYPNTLGPAGREALLERSWPSFLDLMGRVGDHVPGDESRRGVALLTNWRWPQLAGFGPDGDHGSRDFFSQLVRDDVSLGVLALGLGSYTQPFVVDAARAHAGGRPIEYYGNEIAFAWQHLFAGLDEAGHLKTEDFGIIASALKALGGYGVKQGAAAVGVTGGIPGLVLTWAGGEIVGAVVGEIIPGAEPLDIAEGDDYFRQFFFPTSSVVRPDGTPVRDVSVFQIDTANALLTTDPALLDGLAPSPWIVDGSIVAPTDPGRQGTFAGWFRDLTALDGAAWTDRGANDTFAHTYAEVTGQLANQVGLGVDS